MVGYSALRARWKEIHHENTKPEARAEAYLAEVSGDYEVDLGSIRERVIARFVSYAPSSETP